MAVFVVVHGELEVVDVVEERGGGEAAVFEGRGRQARGPCPTKREPTRGDYARLRRYEPSDEDER